MTTSMDPPAATTNSATTGDETSTSTTMPPPSSSPPPASESETLSSPPPSTMGPPPPQNPNTDSLSSENGEPSEQPSPPPPSSSDNGGPSNSSSNKRHSQNVAVPYSIPEWSRAPPHPFSLEVLKDGAIIDKLDVTKKGAYMFGRIELCDFMLEHPTISRFHAVLQFKGNGNAYLYDIGSTHGTSINKKQVPKKEYVELHVGDVIRFGQSSRLYIFQGPSDLMPPEVDLTRSGYAKEREASLRRAREDAAVAEGVSWGMREDAIEEEEDDSDEITWQNYKGELTDKQQKTREKVLKRMEKIAHMKKEMAAIRAKGIAQGGLTQGQQTQIARNEMRISQILEELESLEETLNDSIRESMGARAGRSHGRQKGAVEDEDDFMSDDDEFYDRTKKKPVKKSADTQSIETADSLLDKREALTKEMEEKRRLLVEEKKMSESVVEQEAGDELDAFMSGLSSQLVLDKTMQLEKELSSLQSELDRVVYLLKIADPTGDAAKKREAAARELKSDESISSSSVIKRPEKSKTERKNAAKTENPASSSITKEVAPHVIEEASDAPKPIVDVTDSSGGQAAVYTVAKPQWLGAVEKKIEEGSIQENKLDADEGDGFVDYKDRKKILNSNSSHPGTNLDSDLESAAPGLILRKKKHVESTETGSEDKPSASESSGADMIAEDVVALLLKHKRGLHASVDEALGESRDGGGLKQSGRDNKRPKRVLGPEKPTFLETNADYETWVPPEGQSGDGRTSLIDRLGY